MKWTVLVVLLTIVMGANAQTVRTFKGKVINASNSLPMGDVSVCLYRAADTSLLNFAFTTKLGNFSITTSNKDSLILIVSVIGFDEIVKKQEPREVWSFIDYGDMRMVAAAVEYSSVKVSGAAIRMRGDTIEINANRFKVLPGSDVAQLFKKIPGFEISVKGEIKVNGNEVTKIMVDGSDFFGNNPGLVSKNLNADMIETVQVYEENKETGGNQSDKGQTSVINLKLKKGKKNGTFGDVMAGYGTKERYEAGLRLNNFKNDRKFSVIINGNNTNETGFDFGFDNWHRAQSVNKNQVNNTHYYFQDFSSDRGNINNKISGGATYFNEFSKKRKLSFNAFVAQNHFSSINSSKVANAVSETNSRNMTDSSNFDGTSKSFDFSVNYTKDIDSTGGFSVNSSIKIDDNNTNTLNFNKVNLNQILVNDNRSVLKDDKSNRTISLSSTYGRNARKNKNYKYSIGANYSNDVINNSTNQSVINYSDTFNNKYQRDNKVNDFLFKLSGTLPVYKTLLFTLSADYWYQQSQLVFLGLGASDRTSSSFEQTYQNNIDSLSKTFDNNFSQQSVKGTFSKSTRKNYVSFGSTFLNFNVDNKAFNIKNNYPVFVPFFNYYSWGGKQYISFNFSKSVDFPTVNQLAPIFNLNNNFNRNLGNKDLKPQERYYARTYFNIRKNKYFKSMGMGLGGNYYQSAYISGSVQGGDGIVKSRVVNTTGKMDMDNSIYISKTFFSIVDLNLSGRYNYQKNPFLINNTKGFNTSNMFTFSPGIDVLLSDSLEFNFNLDINNSTTNNSLNTNLNYKQTTYSYDFGIRTVLSTGTELSSTFNLNDQRNVPGIGKFIPVWSAFVQQSIDKKGIYNLKLTAYDILNKNTNISRYATENSVIINQSNRLTRYFMLTLVCKLRKINDASALNQSVY